MALPAGRRGIRADLVKSDGTISDLTELEEEVSALKTAVIKKQGLVLTTNAGGIVQGGVTSFGLPSGAVILSVYFNKGNYSNLRNVEIEMYGTAGYRFKFYDDGTPVASSEVNITAYYVVF